MSIQAVLSVVQQDKVVLKVVTGCGGERIGQLMDWILECEEADPVHVGNKCLELNIGCEKCFVVQCVKELRGEERVFFFRPVPFQTDFCDTWWRDHQLFCQRLAVSPDRLTCSPGAPMHFCIVTLPIVPSKRL